MTARIVEAFRRIVTTLEDLVRSSMRRNDHKIDCMARRKTSEDAKHRTESKGSPLIHFGSIPETARGRVTKAAMADTPKKVVE